MKPAKHSQLPYSLHTPDPLHSAKNLEVFRVALALVDLATARSAHAAHGGAHQDTF